MRVSRRLLVITAGLVVLACGVRLSAEQPQPLTITHDESVVSISSGELPVLKYRYAGAPFKPYVQELFTPKGVQVLRDSPDDHKHHHALMFALTADGVDFWSENEQCGSQRHVELGSLQTATSDGVPRAQLSQKLQWTAPRDGEAVLLEQRTIRAYRTEDIPATLVTWEACLRPAPGREAVQLTGAHYVGLGVRFVQSMDRVGQFQSAGSELGEPVRGTERVGPARWCAYTAPADGNTVTVALFDHPANPRHPAPMFTMIEHFAYLSATLNLWKQPLVIPAEKPLSLRYGVALWDGAAESADIERTYQKWLQLERP